MIYDAFGVKITLEVCENWRTCCEKKMFHMNVAIKLHRICTCKTKICDNYYYV